MYIRTKGVKLGRYFTQLQAITLNCLQAIASKQSKAICSITLLHYT